MNELEEQLTAAIAAPNVNLVAQAALFQQQVAFMYAGKTLCEAMTRMSTDVSPANVSAFRSAALASLVYADTIERIVRAGGVIMAAGATAMPPQPPTATDSVVSLNRAQRRRAGKRR